MYHGSDVSLEGDEKFQWVKKINKYYSKALSVISANQVVLEIRDGEMTTLEYLKLFPIGYSLILKKKNRSKWTSITGLGSNIPTHKWCFFTVWYDLVQLAFPLQLVGLDYRLVVLPLLP